MATTSLETALVAAPRVKQLLWWEETVFEKYLVKQLLLFFMNGLKR